MKALDLDRPKSNNRGPAPQGCGVAGCTSPTFAYISVRAQRAGDRASIGSAHSRFCRVHVQQVFADLAATLGASS